MKLTERLEAVRVAALILWTREAQRLAASRMREAYGLGEGTRWLQKMGIEAAPAGAIEPVERQAIAGHLGRPYLEGK